MPAALDPPVAAKHLGNSSGAHRWDSRLVNRRRRSAHLTGGLASRRCNLDDRGEATLIALAKPQWRITQMNGEFVGL
jgi:hypothetical protein